MKTFFKFFSIAVLCTPSLMSCDQDIATKTAEKSDLELITYKGETVVAPAGFPKELFDQSAEEFEVYFNGLLGGANSRGAQVILTYDELGSIFRKNVEKYPKITSDNVISHDDVKRILTDFPKLSSVDEINEKRTIIFDYYQDLCKRDVAVDIASFAGKRNARILSPGTPSGPEQVVLASNPAYALAYYDATNQVNATTQNIYGNLADNNMGNAFRHAVWNAFIIHNILISAPASENQAIDFAQDGTSAHEKNSAGQQHTIQAAMDLHNNSSARTWMERVTSWGIGPLRKMPNHSEIVSEMQAKASIATHYNHLVDPIGAFNLILNEHGGNNATTWNNLYNNLYSGKEHLVRIE